MRYALLLLCCTAAAFAEQSKIPDYETARYLLWSQVYAAGGRTLYCGQAFGAGQTRGLNVEHVFPMSWVSKALGCGQRRACRETSARFNRIEADLHNLYVSRIDVNDERGSYPFAMIKGEERRFGRCDFEVHDKRRVVEPRDAARGEIARAMFYMADAYGLPIHRKQGRVLKQWHFQDAVSHEEKRRNDIIERLQGTRNPYIDNPQLADQLPF